MSGTTITSSALLVPQSRRKKRAAVSFTGGKDCHLAMTRCCLFDKKNDYEIVCLVIFHPPSKKFRAHPIAWQEQQAAALGLPLALYCVEAITIDNNNTNIITEPCYKQGYARAIRELHRDYSVDIIITGDIDYVGSVTTNFMTEVCETFVPHVSIELPLWQTKDRRALLLEMIEQRGFRIIFSCVKEPLDASWIGRRLDRNAIRDLEELDIDMTGENGEYHTMVLNVPSLYAYPLKLIVMNAQKGEDDPVEKTDTEEERQQQPESSPPPMALELNGQLGQKERWWVCHPDVTLKKDTQL